MVAANGSGSHQRRVVWIGSESVSIDWLTFFAHTNGEFRADWRPVVFIELAPSDEFPRWYHHWTEAVRHIDANHEASAIGELVLLKIRIANVHSSMLLLPAQVSHEGQTLKGLASFVEAASPFASFWYNSAVTATEALSHDLTPFSWTAAIGPLPQDSHAQGATRRSLAQPLRIADLALQPLGRCIIDRPYSYHYPSLMARASIETWPIEVSGTSLGFDRHQLRESVVEELTILCGVLSVATSIPFVIREVPFAFSDNQIRVAEDWYGPTDSDHVEGIVELDLPSWIPTMYSLSKVHESIRNALLTFREGLMVESSHPSLAPVAYMSSAQTLGSLLENRENKQLAAMIGKVRDSESTKNLLRYYGHRSSTAHEAVLWGSEPNSHSQGLVFNPFAHQSRPFWSILNEVREAVIDSFVWISDNLSENLLTPESVPNVSIFGESLS